LNWQVLNVLIVKFQASSLDLYFGSMLINLSYKALVNLSMPNIALEQEVIAAAITIALILFLYASDAARSTETEQRIFSEALTSNVGVLQNFRVYKKWIPLSSNFWAIYSRL